MTNFAKIFDSEEFGQIVVIIDDSCGPDKDYLKFMFRPEWCGLSWVAIGYDQTEAGKEALRNAFEAADQTIAESKLRQIFD